MKSKLIGFVTSLMLFGAMPSQASSLVDLGDNTYDPNTGLMWLDVTLTTNHSYNDIVTNYLGVGQPYYGYRYATTAEVSTLFTNAGVINPYEGSPNGNASAVQTLIALLGATYTDTSMIYTWGLTGTFYQQNTGIVETATLLLMPSYQFVQSPDNYDAIWYASFSRGSFLVATPLPSTWLMLLSGFVGLGFFAYRGTKKRSAALAA